MNPVPLTTGSGGRGTIAMGTYWRVRLFGELQAVSADERVGRFRTRRVGLLLAHLAYNVGRGYPREELADLLWPESDGETGRSNLRQALSSLRKHLEPPAVPPGTVLEADRSIVRLRPEAVECDAAEFRRVLDGGPGRSPSPEQLSQAVDLYEGDLLPGFYENWVLRERLRLEDLYITALKRRAHDAEERGEFENAARDLHVALAKDPLRRDIQDELERLYGEMGQPFRAERYDVLPETVASGSPHPVDSSSSRAQGRSGRTKARSAPVASPEDRVASETPPAAPQRIGAATNRLPLQITRFFGRQKESAIASATLAQRATRLLSIVGPAGVGKSRLSVEIARSMAEEFAWDVRFVPLADLSDGRQLPNAILAALKIDGREGDPLDLIVDRLDEAPNLLVLDNLEHLVESAIPAIESLLARAPNVTILATTRQALKMGGERELTLDPLPLPSVDTLDTLDLESLGRVPSVALFVDRAKGPLADFGLSAHNAPAIVGICGKLEGLPLALEIAAGLAGVFSPFQILQNLDSQLALLKSRRRDLNARHRSLRAAIESGYELLSEVHKSVFVGLSVFRDGFSVSAVAAVCAPDRSESEVLDIVLDLRERSFLQAIPSEGVPRFRLLESYREFATERLDPSTLQGLRLRHARHFRRLAEAEAIGREDRGNRAAALRTLYEERAVPECVALMHSYGRFPQIDEDIVEGLARDPGFETFAPIDQVRILGFLDVLQYQRSEFGPALETCRRARDLAQSYGLEAERVRCANRYVRALRMLGHNEEVVSLARLNLDEAIRADNLLVIEAASATLGGAYWALGRLDQAREVLEGACDASRRRRKGSADWVSLYNLALIQIDSGQYDDGRGIAEEVRREAASIGDELGVLSGDVLLCRIELLDGDPRSALRLSHDVLTRRKRMGMLFLTLEAIAFHADVLATLGRFYDAAVLLGASRRSGLHHERETSSRVAKARSGLPRKAFDRAWSQGCRMTPEQAFRHAVQLRDLEPEAFEIVHDL